MVNILLAEAIEKTTPPTKNWLFGFLLESFLVRVLIEAVKFIKIKAGDKLQKPPIITMAPTANASAIINGAKSLTVFLVFYLLMSTSMSKQNQLGLQQ